MNEETTAQKYKFISITLLRTLQNYILFHLNSGRLLADNRVFFFVSDLRRTPILHLRERRHYVDAILMDFSGLAIVLLRTRNSDVLRPTFLSASPGRLIPLTISGRTYLSDELDCLWLHGQ